MESVHTGHLAVLDGHAVGTHMVESRPVLVFAADRPNSPRGAWATVHGPVTKGEAESYVSLESQLASGQVRESERSGEGSCESTEYRVARATTEQTAPYARRAEDLRRHMSAPGECLGGACGYSSSGSSQ